MSDFVTYDELRGPDLDAALWDPAHLPLPTGSEHIPLETVEVIETAEAIHLRFRVVK